MVFKKNSGGGGAAAASQAQAQDDGQVSKEAYAYAFEQCKLQQDDDALNTALHYLILANAPVWARLQILDIRDRMGFDNSQWQTPNAQKSQ